MTLPGKLTIGFLQEDNPQKFYFRVRPLVIQDEGNYCQAENAKQDFAEDGFIRIVPDKNELSHFKTRMRTLGRYCAIDLRRHTGENDKIRPNKNHNGENGDRNAYIVYSDVIATVEPLRMAEVVMPGESGMFARPGTRLVAAAQADGSLRVFQWKEEGEAGAVLSGENLAASVIPAEAAMAVALPDETEIRLLMDLERFGVAIPAAVEEAPAPAPAPVQPRPEPVVRAEAPARVEPKEEAPAPRAEEAPEKPAAAQESVPEKPKEADEPKPWLQGTTYVFPRVVAAKGSSPREQSLAQQSGFNPRRSLSIKDIVDDMWRQSRFDQLGHPVVEDAPSTPVVSPVEQAMEAVREAWSLPEARASLVQALLKLEKMDDALGACGAQDAAAKRAQAAGEQQAVRLEADRLKLLGEIDELKRFRQDKRAELLNELRRTHNAEFDRSEQRNRQLQDDQEKYRQAAEAAKKASEAAEAAFDGLLGKELDRVMSEQLLAGRAMELMNAMNRGACKSAVRPETEELSAGELISAVRVRFEEAGIPLTNDEAVNLLACVALGRKLILSGPSGSGKSRTARVLAASLGIANADSGCFAEVQAQSFWRSLGQEIETGVAAGVRQVRMPEVKRVLENNDMETPTMLLVDGANRAAMDEYLGEMLNLGEEGAPGILTTGAGGVKLGGSLRLMLTVQDSGTALSGELLDRSFLIRLEMEKADSVWPPKSGKIPAPEKAVSLASLQKIFAPGAELPYETVERVRVLREKLAAKGMYLSRRALTDLYNYCSAVQPYMTCTPMEILDMALSQRVMPYLLATANLDTLHEIGKLLPDMPKCLKLMNAALPLPPM